MQGENYLNIIKAFSSTETAHCLGCNFNGWPHVAVAKEGEYYRITTKLSDKRATRFYMRLLRYHGMTASEYFTGLVDTGISGVQVVTPCVTAVVDL